MEAAKLLLNKSCHIPYQKMVFLFYFLIDEYIPFLENSHLEEHVMKTVKDGP